MTTTPRHQLELWKRKKKAAHRKMQSAIKANNWAEARNEHWAFHHYGDLINKLEESAKQGGES